MIRATHILAAGTRQAREAEAVGDREDQEAYRRSAVSRAYHAAFHHALVVALERTHRFNKGKSDDPHKQLVQFFQEFPDRDFKKFAAQMERLRMLWIKAEYYLGVNVSAAETDEAIHYATRIMGRPVPSSPLT